MEGDGAHPAGRVHVLVGLHVDLEVGGGIDVDHPAVADDLAVREHLVGVHLQRAEDTGRQVKLVLRLAVLDVEPFGQHRLAAAYHIEVHRGQASGGADVEVERIATFVDGLVRTDQDVFAQRFTG